MRDIHILFGSFLFACIVVFSGCSTDELSGTEPTDGNGSTVAPFTITVTDGGYTPGVAARQSTAGSDIRQNADGRPSTRAADNGYATTFTAGDRIGLYVVKNKAIVAQNICLTATDNGSNGLSWTGNAYYEGAGATYFAYYPYRQTLPAASGTPDATAEPVKPDATANDASGFFAPLISAWTPDTDQGTHAKYTAQDLMTGSGTIGAKQSDGTYSLSFTMTHAMALVIIKSPGTKYTLTDKDSKPLPDYYIPAPDTRFYGFTPCLVDGAYRYLVKPGQSGAADLMGSYTATGSDGSTATTKEYAVSPNGITAANYALYKVDGAAVTQKTHTLQAGDFYMNDGSLLGKDETNLTPEQKATCIGIVYWVGDPTNTTNGDPLLGKSEHHPDCKHGLVIALHKAKLPSASAAAKMSWSNSSEQVNNWTNHNDRGANKVNITVVDKYQGYANTVALKAYNESSKVTSDANYKVLPIAAIEQYSKDYPAPTNSSGWYVPSIMELKYMCWGQGAASQSTAGRDLLNSQFDKAGGTKFDNSSWYYWASSESADYSYSAWLVDFNNGLVDCDNKGGYEFWVRALFAF